MSNITHTIRENWKIVVSPLYISTPDWCDCHRDHPRSQQAAADVISLRRALQIATRQRDDTQSALQSSETELENERDAHAALARELDAAMSEMARVNEQCANGERALADESERLRAANAEWAAAVADAQVYIVCIFCILYCILYIVCIATIRRSDERCKHHGRPSILFPFAPCTKNINSGQDAAIFL